MTDERLETLIIACRQMDRQSQQEVYNHFYGVVFGVCLRYAGSSEEAKELANDSFFKAFTRLEQFEPGGNFGGWLYTIARRTALDRYRVAVRQPQMLGFEAIGSIPTTEPERQILDQLDAEEKLKLVQQLPPAYRTVFNLYVIEEYTHEEISEALGISMGASKSNLSKARAKLREMVEKFHAPIYK